MKISHGWQLLKRTPMRIVEWIIAVQTILGGLYIISPLVGDIARLVEPSVLAKVVVHPYAILAVGSIFLLSGILIAAGLIFDKYQLRATGLFVNICVRIYGILGTWLLIGFLPPSWLAGLAIMLIAVVAYFAVKREQRSNGTTT